MAIWPLEHILVTDGFGPRKHPITGEVGRMHWGVDFAAGSGRELFAIGDGVVTALGSNLSSTGAGHWINIKLDGGPEFGYWHMLNRATLAVGARVAQGDVIGYVGSTGASTGPHLHLEMYVTAGKADALAWLESNANEREFTMSQYDNIIAKLEVIETLQRSNAKGNKVFEVVKEEGTGKTFSINPVAGTYKHIPDPGAYDFMVTTGQIDGSFKTMHPVVLARYLQNYADLGAVSAS